jgi:hypothetical protein
LLLVSILKISTFFRHEIFERAADEFSNLYQGKTKIPAQRKAPTPEEGEVGAYEFEK